MLAGILCTRFIVREECACSVRWSCLWNKPLLDEEEAKVDIDVEGRNEKVEVERFCWAKLVDGHCWTEKDEEGHARIELCTEWWVQFEGYCQLDEVDDFNNKLGKAYDVTDGICKIIVNDWYIAIRYLLTAVDMLSTRIFYASTKLNIF